MTFETGKSMLRRSGDSRFATRYFYGDGIDIGSGNDGLTIYQHMFPLMRYCRLYDKDDGDAMLMANVQTGSYDFVHSSHCLEHLTDPILALWNWLRICRIGGYLVITVPDYTQYENAQWPSAFGEGHQWAFSISGPSQHKNHLILTSSMLVDVIANEHVELIKLELVDRGYNPQTPWFDQSLSPACEPAIEIICRKIAPTE